MFQSIFDIVPFAERCEINQAEQSLQQFFVIFGGYRLFYLDQEEFNLTRIDGHVKIGKDFHGPELGYLNLSFC